MESDSAFVAPEGVYSVTEEHKPPTGPAYPGAATPLFPTRLSTITVRFNNTKPASSPGLAQLLGANLTKDSRKEKDKDKDKDRPLLEERSLSSTDTHDDSHTSPDVSSPQTTVAQDSPISPEAHSLFAHPSGAGKKKATARPKHNMRTTSSTFLTRVQTIEGLNKILSNKHGDVTFLFYNYSKAFFWVEVGSKSKEPLTRIAFSAFPTCHDVNPFTASPERLDVVIGFSSGDLVWFVSHADGTILVYDKERDDGVFSVSIPGPAVPAPNSLYSNSGPPPSGFSQTQSLSPPQGEAEWNPLAKIFVTAPPWHPESNAGGKERTDKGAAKNPVSHWRVSRRSVVGTYVAAISEDGCLRVIDALGEQLTIDWLIVTLRTSGLLLVSHGPQTVVSFLQEVRMTY
ncbi:hypothetical protein ID866_2768 [Astraeus odoratus]|nr:hypothetical protein ID866_2768 [Astraeus odoratus]